MELIKRIFRRLFTPTIKIGKTIEFSCKIHVSVGYYSKIIYDDNYFDCDISTTIPRDCDPGGDRGVIYYKLTALKKGTTEVEIIKYYRGTIEKQKTRTYRIK